MNKGIGPEAARMYFQQPLQSYRKPLKSQLYGLEKGAASAAPYIEFKNLRRGQEAAPFKTLTPRVFSRTV